MGATSSVLEIFHKCNHEYADKWGDSYKCMDCRQDIVDSVRVQKEKYMESFVVEDKNPAGFTRGKLSQLRGLPIWWIVDWTIENNCWNYPTWKVRRNIIVPATHLSRCRYVELPHLVITGFVGPATTYVSHSWQACWGDLVAALCDGDADRNRRVWIDLFAVRQWPSNQPDMDVEATIAECISFMLVFPNDLDWISDGSGGTTDTGGANALRQPKGPENARHPFRRSWCLFELYIAASLAQSKDKVIIIKGGHHKMHTDGSIEFVTCRNILASVASDIDIERAESIVPQDQQRILAFAESRPGGVSSFHAMLSRAVTGAAYCFADSVLHSAACGDVLATRKVLQDPQAIVNAAASGYCHLLSVILDEAMDVNRTDGNGWTALIHAARAGHVSAIETLLDHSADHTMAVPETGWTALHFAAAHGHGSCVEYLLMEGADVNAQSLNGSTALMFAAELGFEECVQHILADAKVMVDLDDVLGRTALMRAAQSGQILCVTVLAAKGGAQLDIGDRQGYSALIYATLHCHVDCVDALLDFWATVDYRDYDDKTALMYAASYGYTACVEALLNRGSDVNARSRSDWTALMYASKFGHLECISTLLKRGANPSLRTPSGWNAVIAAGESGHIDSVQLLRNGIKLQYSEGS